MKRQLKISPIALKDIQDAVTYYNTKQQGLGKRFANETYDIIKKIQEMPEAASISHKDIRYRILPKFPFIITYQFDEQVINIARIFNTFQDPQKL